MHTRHRVFLLVLSLCRIPEESSERTYLCWLMILRFQSTALGSIDPGSVVRKSALVVGEWGRNCSPHGDRTQRMRMPVLAGGQPPSHLYSIQTCDFRDGSTHTMQAFPFSRDFLEMPSATPLYQSLNLRKSTRSATTVTGSTVLVIFMVLGSWNPHLLLKCLQKLCLHCTGQYLSSLCFPKTWVVSAFTPGSLHVTFEYYCFFFIWICLFFKNFPLHLFI